LINNVDSNQGVYQSPNDESPRRRINPHVPLNGDTAKGGCRNSLTQKVSEYTDNKRDQVKPLVDGLPVLVDHLASGTVSALNFFFGPFFAVRIDVSSLGFLLSSSSGCHFLVSVFTLFEETLKEFLLFFRSAFSNVEYLHVIIF